MTARARARRAAVPVAGLALAALSASAGSRPARAGDGPPPTAAASPAVPKDAWAVVDSSVVTKADVDRRAKLLAILLGVPEVPPAASLQTVIAERTVVTHLDRAGIGPGSVTPADVEAARRDLEGAARGAGSDLDKKLHDAGLESEFDLQLRVSVALRKFVDKEATDEKLRETFERRKLLLCDGEVRARSLLVAVRENDGVSFSRAEQLLQAAKPDGSNLEELCRSLSDDPNAALTGGDLDWFGPRSPWIPAEVRRACFEQGASGLVKQPVRAHDGYHVLFVTGTRVLGDATFEKHRETVKNLFLAERVGELVKSWHDEAKIQLAPDAPEEAPLPEPQRLPLGRAGSR